MLPTVVPYHTVYITHSLPQVSLSHVKSKKNESRRRLKKQKKAICGEIYFLQKTKTFFTRSPHNFYYKIKPHVSYAPRIATVTTAANKKGNRHLPNIITRALIKENEWK